MLDVMDRKRQREDDDTDSTCSERTEKVLFLVDPKRCRNADNVPEITPDMAVSTGRGTESMATQRLRDQHTCLAPQISGAAEI